MVGCRRSVSRCTSSRNLVWVWGFGMGLGFRQQWLDAGDPPAVAQVRAA
jgi:hypothetical protein